MKSNLFLVLAIMSVISAAAQTTKSVLFDTYTSSTNNDLKNKFIGDYLFNQLPTGGITGGAIKINGNYDDYAEFKDTLDINASDINASICFKYIANTTTAYKTASLKVATVGAPTMSDFIMAYFTNGDPGFYNSLEVQSEDHTASNSVHDDLIVGNWYKLSLATKRNTYAGAIDTIKYTVSLHNLGASGTGTPQLISTKTGYIRYMVDFYNPDYDIVVGISGNLGGGAEYLDNFSVTGTFIGQPTAITPIVLEQNIVMPTVVNNNIPITYNGIDQKIAYRICNIKGNTLKTGMINKSTDIEISSLAAGDYIITFFTSQSKLTKKFVKR